MATKMATFVTSAAFAAALVSTTLGSSEAESVSVSIGDTPAQNNNGHQWRHVYDASTKSMRRVTQGYTEVPDFDLHMVDATIDHFSYVELPTFPLRVFVNDTFWDKEGSGPIFFYTGNEAPITEFIKNTGLLMEWAPRFKAMVVFAEHRYYGDDWENGSFPFGQNAFEPNNLRYLTVEQALADFVDVTVYLRDKYNAPATTAIIPFGGSYGANLAMWSRTKYPNIWAGAIASSVSVQKHVLRSTNDFSMIVTEAYGNVSAKCPEFIRKAWDLLDTLGKTESGRKQIQEELALCNPPSSAGAASGLGGWYGGAIETMVQYGYPYPTSFYNPVPGYPFKVTCEKAVKYGSPLGAFRAAAETYYNYTGQAGSCFNFGVSARSDLSGPPSGWGYQTCTEVYQPMPTNGLYPAKGGDMYPPSKPNKTAIFASCQSRFGVTPRINYEETHFWGPNIATASNIFLSAGQVDPWRAAGIPVIVPAAGASTSPSIEIHENLMGAHHLDIRASNPLDPESVVECRTKQAAAITKWIAEWKANPPVPIY